MKLFSAAFGAALLMSSAGMAATLDFEDYSGGTNLEAVPITVTGLPTVTITSGNASKPAMVFDTNCNGLRNEAGRDDCTGQDDDLSGPFPETNGGDDLVAGKVLIISEDGDSSDPDDNARGGVLTFTFTEEVTFLGFDLLDIEEGKFELRTDGVVSATDLGVNNDGEYQHIDFGTGLTGMVFEFDFAGSGAVDNLQFVSAVPGPASGLLLLGALGMLRRRRRHG